MELRKSIIELSKRSRDLVNSISTEEATKTALVMPLLSILGYNVFDPSEFCPEYVADYGIKKGEKVDYAILENGEPTILIECKSCRENLDKHGSQLFRYFSTTKAKLGVLTNGLEYRFYTDSEEINIMDANPFFIFKLDDLSDNSIQGVSRFSKTNFSLDDMYLFAKGEKIDSAIKTIIKEELCNPSDEFIEFIFKKSGFSYKLDDRIRKIIISRIKEAYKGKVDDQNSSIVTKVENKSLVGNNIFSNLLNSVISEAKKWDNVKVNVTPGYVSLIVGNKMFAEMKANSSNLRVLLYEILDSNREGIENGIELIEAQGLKVRLIPEKYGWRLRNEFKLTDECQYNYLLNYIKMSYNHFNNEIVTTEDELKVYKIIEGILSEVVPLCNISYIDCQDYFSIIYEDDVNKEVCRVILEDKGSNRIRIPGEDGKLKTSYIDSLSIEGISKYRDKIIKSVKRFL